MKLEWQVEYIEKNGTDAVHGNLMMINNNDNVINKEKWEKENDERREVNWEQLNNEELARRIFLKPNIRIISSVVTREIFEKIRGFKDQFFGGEDETFWFEVGLFGKVGFLDRVVFYRREHENNSLDIYRIKRLNGYLKSVRYIHKYYRKIIANHYTSKEFRLLWACVATRLKSRKYLSSFRYFLEIFLLYPIKTIKNIIKMIK